MDRHGGLIMQNVVHVSRSGDTPGEETKVHPWVNGIAARVAARMAGQMAGQMAGKTAIAALVTALGTAMPALIQPAEAQSAASGTTAQPPEEVQERLTVTGSRIARDNFTSDSPLTVVTGESLQRQGFTDIGQALRQQLAVTTGGFGQSNVLAGGGASSIDLRNLGRQRVLVLINGRRVAPFADALGNETVDLSFIPTTFVERVEILRDGASSTYGADAVSGVINIILREDFEGMNVSGQFGITTEGDAESTVLSTTIGAGNDRGNVVVNVEYRKREPVRQVDRDWAVPAISFLNNNVFFHGSSFSPGGLFLGDGGAIVCADFNAFNGLFQGDGTTDLFAETGNCPLAGFVVADSPDEVVNYDYAFEQNIINGQELFNAATFGTYELAPWLQAFVEMEFSKREGNVRLDGNPGSLGTPSFPAGWRVPATNPFNFTGEDGGFRIRPTNTIGPRQTMVETNMFRAVVGLEGTLLERFQWELSYLWTRVDSQIVSDGLWNLARAIRISDPDQCGADPICASITGPENAFDVFFPGNWTQDQIDYLAHDNVNHSQFATSNLIGVISGDVWELPAGPVGVALGFEYRDENGQTTPDSVIVSGESVSNQVFPASGQFDVFEVFGEVNIPLLKDLPLAKELSVNLQGRWFDFSNFGSDTVFKLGAVYAPTEDARFRASYGTSFRAPTVTDLFAGGVVSFANITDPCAGYGGLDPQMGNNANIIANCEADGLAPNFIQPAPQYSVTQGGNEDLQPEEGTSYTIGVVLTPRFLPGFQASLDHYYIKVKDIITSPTADSIIDACYQGPVGLEAPECDLFSRSPTTGVAVGLLNPLQNLGFLETKGLEFNIIYTRDIAAFGFLNGTVTFDVGATYLQDLNVNGDGQAGDTGDSESRGSSSPRWRSNAELTWEQGPVLALWRTRHIGPTDDPAFDGNNPLNYNGTPNHIEHDIFAEYAWRNVRFSAGINNLFNAEPEYVFAIGNNTDINLYGTAALGRFAFARVSADF